MESISLKLIFRSWWRNKTFAVISLLSLAAGITCTNLLISYVIYESRIEAHNPNKSHIIYMAQDSPLTSGEKVSFIKGKIPVQLKDQYPEVEGLFTTEHRQCRLHHDRRKALRPNLDRQS